MVSKLINKKMSELKVKQFHTVMYIQTKYNNGWGGVTGIEWNICVECLDEKDWNIYATHRDLSDEGYDDYDMNENICLWLYDKKKVNSFLRKTFFKGSKDIEISLHTIERTKLSKITNIEQFYEACNPETNQLLIEKVNSEKITKKKIMKYLDLIESCSK